MRWWSNLGNPRGMSTSTFCFCRLALLMGMFCAAGHATASTQVVFLGTGTPLPDPDRSGPCTAVVINGTPYLIDAGPGLVRRASAAVRKGVIELKPTNLKIAFVTHLHVDHTAGLADLIFTPWIMGREDRLHLYGPPGLRAMSAHLLAAYAEDIRTRTEGLEHSNKTGYRVDVHEIQPGDIYQDRNVTVTAFRVPHGSLPAFGYRFQTPDRVIVISGDTTPNAALLANCQRCDLLIHEVYTEGSTAKVSVPWQKYRQAYHTSTVQLAQIATTAKPRLLVIYHRANPGCDQNGAQCGESGSEEEALREIRAHYSGKVVAAHDLDIY
jgi:ribonuclease BN (tRNA processing enzyme)